MDLSSSTMDQLAEKHVALRAALSAEAKKFAALEERAKAALTKLETAMLGKLNADGVKSMSTVHGTVYKQTELKPSCADWQTFYKFVQEHDAFHMLQKRLTKEGIQEYMDQNDGHPPPGVSVRTEFAVRVRRS